jgi:hypothetical protein
VIVELVTPIEAAFHAARAAAEVSSQPVPLLWARVVTGQDII